MDKEKIIGQALDESELEDITGGILGLEKLSGALKQSINKQSVVAKVSTVAKQSGEAKQSVLAHPGSAQFGDYVGYCADCKCDVFTMTEAIHKNHHLITSGSGR